jgi:glycosyltransferase involved in cell wall biosynthesis
MAAVPNPAAGLPAVTVAILAYNRRDELATNLTTIREQLDYPQDLLEVIVVDNASEDGTAAMVRERFPWVKLIVAEENTGIAGWNRAFDSGTGDWFLVLDDDCYMEGDALRRALDAARASEADLVSFGIESSVPGQVFTDWYRTGLLLFWGCAALVSRRAVERVGGFDPNLFIWAHEVEWTMRFLDRGFRHLHLPEVMKPLPARREFAHTRNVRNFGYVIGKLMRTRDVPPALGALLIRTALHVLRYPAWWPGLGATLAGFREGLKVRQPVSAPVSRLYLRNFIEFAPWISLGPRISHVVVHKGAPGTEFFHAYWNARPELYPRAAATLRLR